MKPRATAGLTLAILLTACGWARADPAAERTRKAEARAHFGRGVVSVERGELDAAVEAFEAAYRASPHYSVLYNLAQAHAALGQPVEAAKAYERYLVEGDQRIDESRRAHVEAVLALQRRRIGFVTLEVEPGQVEVSIDGRTVGKSPFAAEVPLAAGTHGLVASADGIAPQAMTLVVKAGERQHVALKLKKAPHSVLDLVQLLVDCDIPDVAVSVDGQILGQTPVTLPLLVGAGRRHVRFSRDGYRSVETKVVLRAGVPSRVRCALAPERAGAARAAVIDLDVSPSQASVMVDGTGYRMGRLPPGRHRIQVSYPGYYTWERSILLLPAARQKLEINLEATPELKTSREQASTRRRHWALGVGGAGLALIGTAVGTYVWNGNRFESWQRERTAVDAELARGNTGRSVLERDARLEDRAVAIQGADDLAIGLGVAGGLASGLAVALFYDLLGP